MHSLPNWTSRVELSSRFTTYLQNIDIHTRIQVQEHILRTISVPTKQQQTGSIESNSSNVATSRAQSHCVRCLKSLINTRRTRTQAEVENEAVHSLYTRRQCDALLQLRPVHTSYIAADSKPQTSCGHVHTFTLHSSEIAGNSMKLLGIPSAISGNAGKVEICSTQCGLRPAACGKVWTGLYVCFSSISTGSGLAHPPGELMNAPGYLSWSNWINECSTIYMESTFFKFYCQNLKDSKLLFVNNLQLYKLHFCKFYLFNLNEFLYNENLIFEFVAWLKLADGWIAHSWCFHKNMQYALQCAWYKINLLFIYRTYAYLTTSTHVLEI